MYPRAHTVERFRLTFSELRRRHVTRARGGCSPRSYPTAARRLKDGATHTVRIIATER